MKRRLGKRQQLAANLAFVEAVDRELKRAGAEPDPVFGKMRTLDLDGSPREPQLVFPAHYWFNTKAGRMCCYAMPAVHGHGGQFGARFQDVAQARRHFGIDDGLSHAEHDLNVYSGKWNLLLFDEQDPERVRAAVRRRLALVMDLAEEVTT